MAENETQDPNVEEEILREEGESVLDAFVRYQREAAKEGRKAIEAFIPPDVRAHGREAKRNFRRAFKVLLEGIAERIELPEEDEGIPPVSSTGKTKVKVEVT